ncbi:MULTISPECIES: type II secretion system protein N [unclassified Duganella]|uniref:type II secretion system protein N n=1 Tax=unclassified Duganella TaxID=2636909 RepID=UPI00088A1811|nr:MULTISPECIES: type II secretion system protein N [unclassified Duganella]SDG96247.1 general secretion pathway protein C [Duganella sp. OV458]SDJ46113.1 general secretion pathway protein C [Duganella sp. OV510]
MKRLPLIVTVLAVVLLSASLAYWGLQLFKPPQRAITAPPPPPPMGVNLDAAKSLFGGQVTVAVVSNYQLKGVVAARGNDSAAIISVDTQPALAIAIGKEVVPGVTVKEVHARHVIISEGGVNKRLDLPSDAGVSSVPAVMPGLPVQQPQPAPTVMPAPPPTVASPQQQTPNPAPIAPMGIAPIPTNPPQNKQ